MSNRKISPLPWTAEYRDEGCPLDLIFAGNRVNVVCDLIDCVNREANADFIVRAVNSHDALVAVIQDMLSGLEYLRQTKRDVYGFGIDRLEETGKAALTLAKGTDQ